MFVPPPEVLWCPRSCVILTAVSIISHFWVLHFERKCVYVQLPAGAGDDDMHDLTSLYAKARGAVTLVQITLAISY